MHLPASWRDGATITDSSFSVKAVGWNDVPAGQISCLFRKASDLLSSNDKEAFSDYELKDKRFRDHLEGRYKRFSVTAAEGRSSAYCFKSEYNALEFPRMKGNQVHTRSLHAEESRPSMNLKSGARSESAYMKLPTAAALLTVPSGRQRPAARAAGRLGWAATSTPSSIASS